jgi:hypothetical protein
MFLFLEKWNIYHRAPKTIFVSPKYQISNIEYIAVASLSREASRLYNNMRQPNPARAGSNITP